jgi:nucleoside-diphosphate kinase
MAQTHYEEIRMSSPELEQTLVLIKPDALKNSLTGYVLSQLSEFHTGLRFAGAKVVYVSKMLAQEHYAEHRSKPFFSSLTDYIQGKLHYPDAPGRRRVIALVYRGEDAIAKIREVVGPTNPHAARDQRPGSIRSLGTVVPIMNDAGEMIGDRWDNLIHASACAEDAEREIKLWFQPTDIPPAMRVFPTRQAQQHYYVRDGRIYTTHKPDSTCLFAPGDIGWASDLDAMDQLLHGQPSLVTCESVAAKYLINIAEED